MCIPYDIVFASDKQKVYDKADILTTEEENMLNDLCNESGKEVKTDIVICTDNINGGANKRKKYLEDFHDNNNFGYGSKEDVTYILINMNSKNRGFEIQAYGERQEHVNGDRINNIVSKMTPILKEGKYYDALQLFVDMVYNYMLDEPSEQEIKEAFANSDKSEYEEDNNVMKMIISLAIGFILSGIIVGILVSNSSGAITVSGADYIDKSKRSLLRRNDIYIRTTVTKVKKQSSNNTGIGGGSGSGGGVSSGGSSHTGGGGSF